LSGVVPKPFDLGPASIYIRKGVPEFVRNGPEFSKKWKLQGSGDILNC
jgi:hypothetical protein